VEAVVLVSVDRSEGYVRIELTGELDLAVVDYAEAAIDSALDGPEPRVVVHLGGLTFLDVSGVRMLLGAAARARAQGRALEIVAPDGPARRVLTLVGREDLLG
jgi:anti-sigma B factor antagonist